MFNKSVLTAAALLASSASFAATDLTFDIVANVPTAALSLTPQGGWSSMTLPFSTATSSLRPATSNLNVSSDDSADVEAWLLNAPAIQNGSGDNIDLSVSINSTPLSVGVTNKAVIYPASPGSTPTPVVGDIIPITVTPSTSTTHLPGNYTGQVTVVYDHGTPRP